jgi:hypothetical protein
LSGPSFSFCRYGRRGWAKTGHLHPSSIAACRGSSDVRISLPFGTIESGSIRVPDWNCTLQVSGSVPVEARYIGVRSHHVRVAANERSGANVFPCWRWVRSSRRSRIRCICVFMLRPRPKTARTSKPSYRKRHGRNCAEHPNPGRPSSTRHACSCCESKREEPTIPFVCCASPRCDSQNIAYKSGGYLHCGAL